MTRRTRPTRPGTFAAALAVVAWLMLACQASETECRCSDPLINVRIPADRSTSVIDVLPSGPACDGATVGCTTPNPSGGCAVYSFAANASGNCHVDVDFSSGPARFSADIQTVPGGCCGGFYADPISAADLDVPDETADAGGAG